ncbi:MAG: DUF5916 domain-containing protein [Fimbriimonadaceae bacterium]
MRNLLLLLAMLPGSLTWAQDNVLPGYKIAQPPIVDGTIDLAEWDGVPSGQGAFDEDTGERAQDNMRFWLAYDENYIYFAAKVFDSQPSTIRATEYRTNVSLSGDDAINLELDLSGSLADFNQFGMNPRGATEIDLAGGRAAKREWSGEFISQGRITSEGWEVEARIPWRIMRLPTSGVRTIRFNVGRQLQRTQRDYAWQFTGGGNSDRAGKWTGVEIPKAPFERTIKLLPYAYAGADEDEHIVNAGLDMKTNLADQITLIGSINPDFRNIENAILSLDFSRFERLGDETRPFFQEGSSYLESALFASQRISSFDAGLNMHGKLSDKISFGLLNTIDFGEQNSFVGNFSYDPNSTDSYRVTATSLSTPGLDNEGYLVRYNKVLGPVSVFLRNMGTQDSINGDGIYNTASMNYSKKGLDLFAGWDAVSENFLPRLGFAPERDYKGPNVGVSWTKPYSSGPIREIGAHAFYQDYERFDGGHYRETLFSLLSLAFQGGIGLSLSQVQEDFLGTFDRLNTVRLGFPRGNPYRNISLEYDWGRLAMEDYRSIGLGIAYRPIDKLQLTASYQAVDHFERSDQGILGWNYDMGRDSYFSGRMVKRDDDWNIYLSYRKSGNRGAEYYLILGDPNAQTFRTSLILKVVWPFEIR